MIKIVVTPKSDRILVRPIDLTNRMSKGGLHLPDSGGEKDRPCFGEVLAVGEGAYHTADPSQPAVPLVTRPGDRIMFGKWSGQTYQYDGETRILMRESEVSGYVKFVDDGVPDVFGEVEPLTEAAS